MMALLTGWVGEKAAGWIATLLPYLLLPALFLLGQCNGQRIERNAYALATARQTTAIVQTDSNAKEQAASQRAADNSAVANQTEVYSNAIHAAPDSAPDAASVALGCARLRRADRAENSLPVVCRSATGGKAAAN